VRGGCLSRIITSAHFGRNHRQPATTTSPNLHRISIRVHQNDALHSEIILFQPRQLCMRRWLLSPSRTFTTPIFTTTNITNITINHHTSTTTRSNCLGTSIHTLDASFIHSTSFSTLPTITLTLPTITLTKCPPPPSPTPPLHPTHLGEKFAPPSAILIKNRGSLIPNSGGNGGTIVTWHSYRRSLPSWQVPSFEKGRSDDGRTESRDRAVTGTGTETQVGVPRSGEKCRGVDAEMWFWRDECGVMMVEWR